jgi:YtxH-like protein
MRNFRMRRTAQDWARMALEVGLLLTAPKVRAEVADHAKQRFDDLKDNVNEKYDEAVERLVAARSALQGRSQWPWRTLSFVAGVGVGAGVGLLFAPVSGKETREAIRDKAVDVKDRIATSAAGIRNRMPQSVTSMAPTGTDGD